MRLVEHALRASETRYRHTGRVIDVNPFLAELPGSPRNAFLGSQKMLHHDAGAAR